MTEVANPAIQMMLEQQQQVLALIDELQLKTVWSIQFGEFSIVVNCEIHEIENVNGVTFSVNGDTRYATFKRDEITIIALQKLEV